MGQVPYVWHLTRLYFKMKEIVKYLNNNRHTIVDFTRQLIRIPTINPPGKNYEKMVTLLQRTCMSMGLETKRHTVPRRYLRGKGIAKGSPRINLIAEWNTRSRKTLHICSHYDVVPVTDRWKTDPFKPLVTNDRIYGRGAEDMKGTIASILFAIKALKACRCVPKVNLQLSFTPDEEIGGETGFGWLVKNKLITADYGISEGYSDGWAACGNKGVVWFDVEVFGKSAHASSPRRGINAFEKMIAVANELFKLKETTEKKKTKIMTRYFADRHATLVMGGEVRGGSKVNIVPDRSAFTIDRRLLPGEKLDTVIRQVKAAVEKAKRKDSDLRVKVTVRTSFPAVASDIRSPLFKAFRRSVREITNKKPQEALLSGATDLRFLMKKNIPCLGYSARGGQKWHSDNEFIYINSLLETSKILSHTILYLSPQV
jgi:succinyl-diaminopimelate desuccinylase